MQKRPIKEGRKIATKTQGRNKDRLATKCRINSIETSGVGAISYRLKVPKTMQPHQAVGLIPLRPVVTGPSSPCIRLELSISHYPIATQRLGLVLPNGSVVQGMPTFHLLLRTKRVDTAVMHKE